MDTKEPVILVVRVDAPNLRWFLASVRLDDTSVPLLRSEAGDLAAYQGVGFDDQVSFLRHRICGVLQRGYDLLRIAGQKPCQLVVLFIGSLPEAGEGLRDRVAENLAEWMLAPPIVVLDAATKEEVAGSIDPSLATTLANAMPALANEAADLAQWEVSTRKGTWRPAAENASG